MSREPSTLTAERVREALGNTKAFRRNKTMAKGVCFDSRKNKFQARIKINNKGKHLGYFVNKDDAAAAYEAAEQAAYGEYAHSRNGR